LIDCDLSVGLESGLIEVPNTKSGYMDITMCAIYDGKNFHLGGSSVFEYPKSMIDLVFSKDYEIDEAAKEAGFSHDENIGEREGVIGALTKGYLNRTGYSKQAVITALIHLLNPEHY
jgi:inosine/xanthosine triphosphatase